MPTPPRVPLILDMDFGIDDSMATLYLAASGRAEIVAVGTVHGNTSAAQAARNARQLLSVLGLQDVPVARGEAEPWNQDVHYAATVHGEDGIGGMASTDEPPGTIVDETAAEQIVRLARERPGELVLLATGTLTNLGRGSRGGTRGCVGELTAMGSWEVSGKQVLLKDRNGTQIGSVYKTADNAFSGQSSSGQPIALSR